MTDTIITPCPECGKEGESHGVEGDTLECPYCGHVWVYDPTWCAICGASHAEPLACCAGLA